jgi:hypothetical protein
MDADTLGSFTTLASGYQIDPNDIKHRIMMDASLVCIHVYENSINESTYYIIDEWVLSLPLCKALPRS